GLAGAGVCVLPVPPEGDPEPVPLLDPVPVLPPGAGAFGCDGGLTLTVVGAGLTLMLVWLPLAPPTRSGPVNKYQAITANTASTIRTVSRLIPAAAERSPDVSATSTGSWLGLTLIWFIGPPSKLGRILFETAVQEQPACH